MFDEQPVFTLNDGTVIPQVGYGVWSISDAEAPNIVGQAIKVGYRLIDTAQFYDNERGVGEAIRASGLPREQIFVTSKQRNSNQGYDQTIRGYEETLEKMGLETLDLFLIHWPLPAIDTYVETWKAMVRLKQEGRVRSIGVSNFQPSHLERIIGETGVTPSIDQIELHPAFQQLGLRDYLGAHEIQIECWSPLGRGAALNNPVLAEIGKKHGRSVAQIILRWHLEQGLIAIPKSANAQRMEENFSIFDFALDAEDMALIATLDDPDGRTGADPDTFNKRV